MAAAQTESLYPRSAFLVTPSDTVEQSADSGLYITGAGNLNVQLADDALPVIIAVLANTNFLANVRRVFATSTTATGIVGFRSGSPKA